MACHNMYMYNLCRCICKLLALEGLSIKGSSSAVFIIAHVYVQCHILALATLSYGRAAEHVHVHVLYIKRLSVALICRYCNNCVSATYMYMLLPHMWQPTCCTLNHL